MQQINGKRVLADSLKKQHLRGVLLVMAEKRCSLLRQWKRRYRTVAAAVMRIASARWLECGCGDTGPGSMLPLMRIASAQRVECECGRTDPCSFVFLDHDARWTFISHCRGLDVLQKKSEQFIHSCAAYRLIAFTNAIVYHNHLCKWMHCLNQQETWKTSFSSNTNKLIVHWVTLVFRALIGYNSESRVTTHKAWNVVSLRFVEVRRTYTSSRFHHYFSLWLKISNA